VINFSIDVGIIGAGLAGLTCARHLQQWGFTVALFDKSRGIGGRVATRRVMVNHQEIRLDQGLPCLTIQGERTRALRDNLWEKGLLQAWQDASYICPDGMNSIAKFLATDLEIQRDFLVTRLKTRNQKWSIEGKYLESVEFKAIVIAIPAPQALMLLQASHLSCFRDQLQSITYDPCLTVMAGYADPLPLPSLSADLQWIGLDSSKRASPSSTVFVLHSRPDFAEKYLDSPDLAAVKQELLERSALPTPDWSQIHRWRYALPRRGLAVSCLGTIDPLPLVCCGDWCFQGSQPARESAVEAALRSGASASAEIRRFLT
jgi:renalase